MILKRVFCFITEISNTLLKLTFCIMQSLIYFWLCQNHRAISNKYFLPCVTVDLEFFACAKKQVFCSVGCCSKVTQRPLFLMTSSSTQFAVCHPIPTLQSDIIINNLAANDISISLFSIFILVGINCITPWNIFCNIIKEENLYRPNCSQNPQIS